MERAIVRERGIYQVEHIVKRMHRLLPTVATGEALLVAELVKG